VTVGSETTGLVISRKIKIIPENKNSSTNSTIRNSDQLTDDLINSNHLEKSKAGLSTFELFKELLSELR